MNKLVTYYLLLLSFFSTNAATIKGKTLDKYGPIEYVLVLVENSDNRAVSDADGNFELKYIGLGNHKIVFQSYGYETLTKTANITKVDQVLDLGSISLKEETIELDSIDISTEEEKYRLEIEKSPVRIEVVSQTYFEETEAYNLMEGISTIAGVEERISCGVCGTNDIHLNGMEGRYTLVLIDGMPIVSSLASVYGLNGIPTSMIDKIEIVKGPASAIYGSEAMGGIINIITKSAKNSPKFDFSTSNSTHLESNNSLGFSFLPSKKSQLMLSGNYFRNRLAIDDNKDNFTDFALGDKLSFFSKYKLEQDATHHFSIAARGYYEDRFGGELQWTKANINSDEIYGESILTKRIELISHYDLPCKEDINLDVSYNYHKQKSYYGNSPFLADEQILYNQLTWNKQVKKHYFTSGAALKKLNYNDNTPATENAINQWMPSVFAQDFLEASEKLSFLPGLRLDYLSAHGLIFSPRFSSKWNLDHYTSMRLSAGKGFKVVNLFTEDHAAISGTRTVEIVENLAPEESYNLNLGLQRVFSLNKNVVAKLNLDAFYSYFTNQIIPDYDSDPQKILYKNLDFRSVARGVNAIADLSIGRNLGLEANYTLQNVFYVENIDGEQIKERQFFTPASTANFRLRYHLNSWNSKFVINTKVVGNQRLPEFEEPFARPTLSKTFAQVDLKYSWQVSKKIELGFGLKNALNYTQESPLIDPQNPYGDNFDTSYIYGPLQGRRAYLSFGWVLE